MSDNALREMLSKAVEVLRSASELTMDEVIGVRALPATIRTPEVCFALGTLEGAATALRITRRELLEEFDLLVAASRPT